MLHPLATKVHSCVVFLPLGLYVCCPFLTHYNMQAIVLEPKYPETFRIKGRLCAQRRVHDQALIAYSQANSLEKDMTSFTGKLANSLVMYTQQYQQLFYFFSSPLAYSSSEEIDSLCGILFRLNRYYSGKYRDRQVKRRGYCCEGSACDIS